LIQKYTYKNGVRTVLENIPTVRSVTIGIWVLAGSRNETEENNGISHFLEHMFFKGTSTRTAQQIAEAFDSIGSQVNAFTSKEYTCYYARVLDTHKEYALDILADMFFNSNFDEEEMDREKKVILEEIKMAEDTPDDIIHDLLAQATYDNHPLGFPILGTEDHLKSFTNDTLKHYIEEKYVPENIVISVAGNVDQTFINKIENYFGSFKSKDHSSQLLKPTFHSNSIERPKETEQAHLCLGYKGLPIGNDQIYSLILMNNVLGGSMSSRLFQEIRENKGLAYSVFSYHSSFLDSGLLTIYAGTGKDQLEELQDIIRSTVQSLKKDGLSDREIRNSKEQMKGNLTLSLESTNSRMSRNGRNELLLKRHRSLDELIDQIDKVSYQSIKEVIEDTFKEDPSIALIAPS